MISHSVMSSSLRPHGLQHARPSCLSPSLELCPSSRPLHQWCNQTISTTDTLLSFCSQSFPASGTFPKSWLFTLDDQNTGASASASVLSVNVQGWSPLRLTGLITLLSKGLSEVFSSTTVQRHQLIGILPSYGPALITVHDHWEDHSLYYMCFCLQSNVSAFQHTVYVCHCFPTKKQQSSDFTAAAVIHSDLGIQENEAYHYFHLFPFYLWGSNGIMPIRNSKMLFVLFLFG